MEAVHEVGVKTMLAICHDNGFSHVAWAVCDQCSLDRRVAAVHWGGFRQRFVVGADWDGSTEDGYWL